MRLYCIADAETVRGFKEILDGKHDEVPEMNFYMKGGIEEIKPGLPAGVEVADDPVAHIDAAARLGGLLVEEELEGLATHQDAELDRVVEIMGRVGKKLGVI
mgnify:CR=1 FL=1